MEAQSVFEASVESRVDERVDRERNRHVEREDFEITIAKKRAERLEAQAQEKAAEERLARASEIARRQTEADFHKASSSAFEHEADAEAERRRRDHERQRRHGGEPADDVPEEFAVHYATENRVSAIRRHAEREVQKIRDAAARAGNDLTPDQEAAIDALLNAADRAEAAIRAGGASDLEL